MVRLVYRGESKTPSIEEIEIGETDLNGLVKGGQGRTDEEAEALSETLCWLVFAVGILMLACFVWLAVS